MIPIQGRTEESCDTDVIPTQPLINAIHPDLRPLPCVLTLDHGYSHQWHRYCREDTLISRGKEEVKEKENGGEEGKEEGEVKVHILWYAGLELFIHWHSPSLIQSNTNILREENNSLYHSNCICAPPAAVSRWPCTTTCKLKKIVYPSVCAICIHMCFQKQPTSYITYLCFRKSEAT